jgi:hypothetical protein
MPGAPAAEVAVEEPAVDPEALERIIETLEDETARQRLVEELRALRIAQERPRRSRPGRACRACPGGPLSQVDMLSKASARRRTASSACRPSPSAPCGSLDAPDRRQFFSQVGAVLAAMLSGLIAYAVTVTVLAGARATMESRRPQPPLPAWRC